MENKSLELGGGMMIVAQSGGNAVVNTNAKYPLYIPTYDGSNQCTHPKVLYFENQWNGYYFWLALTPYPNMNDFYENPCVFCSNDMIQWTPIAGANPLSNVASGSNAHYSDVCLVYRSDLDRLEAWYRWRDKTSNLVIFCRNTSTNGTAWSARELMYTIGNGDTQGVSPALLFEDNKYKMWYVNQNSDIRYMESTDGSTWVNSRLIKIPFEDSLLSYNYQVWHIDITHTEIGYEVVFCGYKQGEFSNNNQILFYTKSFDGFVFEKAKIIMQPETSASAWDNKMIYKASLVKIKDIYCLLYSAMNINNEWQIGLCYGSAPSCLQYLDDWRLEVPLTSNGNNSNVILTPGQTNKIIISADGLITIHFTVSTSTATNSIKNGDVLFYIPKNLVPQGNIVFACAAQRDGGLFYGGWATITSAGEVKAYNEASPVRYVATTVSYYR